MALTKHEIDALARGTVALIERATKPLKAQLAALYVSRPAVPLSRDDLRGTEDEDVAVQRRIKMLDEKRRHRHFAAPVAFDVAKELHAWRGKLRELECELRRCFDPQRLPDLVTEVRAVERHIRKLYAFADRCGSR
jgi:hypothetical protein